MNSKQVIGYTTQDYETNAWRNITLLLEEEQHFNNGKKFEISSLHPFLLYTVRGLPFSWIILQLTLAYTGYPEDKMQYSYVPDFYTAIMGVGWPSG